MSFMRTNCETRARHEHFGVRRRGEWCSYEAWGARTDREACQETVFVPVQALGELFNVLVRKAGRSPGKARRAVLTWQDAFPLIETSAEVLLAATDLATDHQLSIWDSVILSAAAATGCRLRLSEDLQDGFRWKGVSATNPFSTRKHPLLAALLAGSGRPN
jgi:predicted nucleic acid-binding protein